MLAQVLGDRNTQHSRDGNFTLPSGTGFIPLTYNGAGSGTLRPATFSNTPMINSEHTPLHTSAEQHGATRYFYPPPYTHKPSLLDPLQSRSLISQHFSTTTRYEYEANQDHLSTHRVLLNRRQISGKPYDPGGVPGCGPTFTSIKATGISAGSSRP